MAFKLKPKPSEVIIKFLKERIESNQGISLQKLTGHLSQLPPEVRTKYGCSVEHLKSFLQQHPQIFKIVNDTNVHVTNDGKRSSLRSSLSGSVESIPASTSSQCGSNGLGQSADEVTTLINVKGKVYRLFPMFGFIGVTDPINTSVFFNVQAFENGEYINFNDSGLQLGECVILDAEIGPPGCEAKFRASKVVRLKNMCNESPTKAMPHNLDTTGTIQNVQEKFGFIMFGRNNRERAFFHRNNIHRPPGVEIFALPDILTVDDKVRFKAKPSQKPSGMVKWEATVVYVPQFSKEGERTPGDSFSDDESGNEVFESDDEPDIAGFLQQKLEDNSPAAAHDLDEASADEDPPVECTDVPCVGDSDEWELFCKRFGRKGRFVPKTETEGEILFGDKVVSASADVTFCDEQPVVNLLWEIPRCQEVFFNAVRSGDGLWIATLVWIGAKPTVSFGSRETFYKRLRALKGGSSDGRQNGTNSPLDQEPSSKEKPRISIHSDVKGRVVKVMEHVGYCEFQVKNKMRKEQFMSDQFYQDGRPCSDLMEALQVGDVIRLEYMLGVDGTAERLHLEFCWRGPRPTNVEPQMTPEQFAQSFGNFVASVDDEDQDSFQGFGDVGETDTRLGTSLKSIQRCKDSISSTHTAVIPSVLEVNKLPQPQLRRSSGCEVQNASLSAVQAPFTEKRKMSLQVANKPEEEEQVGHSCTDAMHVLRPTSSDTGHGSGAMHSGTMDLSEESLRRIAAIVAEELNGRAVRRVVVRDAATQVSFPTHDVNVLNSLG